MNDEQVDYWVRLCPKELQRNENASSASVLAISDGPKRSCTTDMFVKTLRNQEIIARTWLCYSPKVGKTYCLYYKLSNASGNFNTGFKDWAHAYRAMEAHKTSHRHRLNIINLSSRANTDSPVDSQIAQQTAQQES